VKVAEGVVVGTTAREIAQGGSFGNRQRLPGLIWKDRCQRPVVRIKDPVVFIVR
jgi:hypothetical protein